MDLLQREHGQNRHMADMTCYLLI